MDRGANERTGDTVQLERSSPIEMRTELTLTMDGCRFDIVLLISLHTRKQGRWQTVCAVGWFQRALVDIKSDEERPMTIA